MKFYDCATAPSPRRVRMFIAEKGIEIPTETVDILGGENRREPYLSAVNSRGQSPALETDDGAHICEITAICEYLDEKFPGGSLIGANAEERGQTRMWTRRIDLGICEPMANGFRYGEGIKMFEPRMRVIPQASDDLKACAQDILGWLDKELDGKTWVCGERFTLADIMLFGFVNFFAAAGQPINPDLKNITAHNARCKERPSASVE